MLFYIQIYCKMLFYTQLQEAVLYPIIKCYLNSSYKTLFYVWGQDSFYICKRHPYIILVPVQGSIFFIPLHSFEFFLYTGIAGQDCLCLENGTIL